MVDARTRRFVLALVVATAAATSLADDDHEAARRLQRQGEIRSLETILEGVSLAPDSRLLETELERENGRWIYELEVLGADGRVREHRVDATTGELIAVEHEED